MKIIKLKSLLPYLALIILFTGTAFKNDLFEIAKQIEIFTTLYKEVNLNYVDETNPAELMDTAIKNMLKGLDPYTVFLNEQDVEAARINKTGDYTGIGARIKTLKDKLVVIEPYKNFPADEAGLKAGDEIIKVDDVAVADFKQNAADLLKGPQGSVVHITYKRQDITKTANIIRKDIEINAVPLYKLLDDNVGYIALSKFNSKAASETKHALNTLKAEGADKLILDLRGNTGGLLNEAIQIVNFFIPKNQLIVTTKSNIENNNRAYYSKHEPIDTEIPLAVLIDEGSASASEIVSGSLQDLDRAVIIGVRSFGKGLVQRFIKLTYGTQVKITISRYFTPSGRCIQALDYWNRDADGNAIRTSPKNYSAFKTKNGRTVYDSGGIEPDIVFEDAKHSNITKAILKEDLVFNYATQYYYSNPAIDLSSFNLSDSEFNTFSSYLKSNNFSFKTKTEEALERAVETAKDEGLNTAIENEYIKLKAALKLTKGSAINKYKSQLKTLLEYEIVKRYFYREGMYQYSLNTSPIVGKAREILTNSDAYQSILN